MPILGDYCTFCQGPCSCQEGCGCEDSSPCLPNPENGECSDWVKAECVFWMGDDIPNTPIKRGVRLTEIVTYLLARIADHETRIAALE